jgi:glycosyltransferase involved in cell wall biosynthesis
VLVADKSETGLLAALNRLADEPALARAIGQAGRRLATERYDWGDIARQLEGRLLRLVGEWARRP